MTTKDIAKDFFTKTILPVCVAGIFFAIFRAAFTKDGVTDYFLVWILCGIPFGIRHMRLWLIPYGFDLGGTLGTWAINFIVGGLIGGFVLVWRMLCAAWYVILTIYRILTYNSESNRIARDVVYFSVVEDDE